eukprot:TRINITY_DN12596_c0_g1_i1.p1 TRINITY_DN12596_c0_g1~~TRINITY_DN12596_c0_g1_i1.p1  ORF type:complete len:308 (-),score=102.52 TRINITY_DN12596_c0_g1_i1:40-930(-)
MSTQDKLSMPLDDIIAISKKDDDVKMSDRISRRRSAFNKNRHDPYTNSSPSKTKELGTRVYVGNLPWTCSWQDLKDHMKAEGKLNVVYSKIIEDQGRSKGCGIIEYETHDDALYAIENLSETKIKGSDRPIFIREDREDRKVESNRNRDHSRSRSRSPIRSRRVEARSPARARRGRSPSSRTVILRSSSSRSSPNTSSPASPASPASSASTLSRQVFIGNLPYTASWQDLKNVFRKVGNVVRADALVYPDTKKPKGQGIVLFEHRWEALKAIETMDGYEFEGRPIFVKEDKYAPSN